MCKTKIKKNVKKHFYSQGHFHILVKLVLACSGLYMFAVPLCYISLNTEKAALDYWDEICPKKCMENYASKS